jgi:hypothetical protein
VAKCETLIEVARAALKYVFVAVLALFSVQVVAPVRVVTTIEFTYRNEAKQKAPRAVCTPRSEERVRLSAPGYESRTRPEPFLAALFQRPPPLSPLFS